MTPNIQNQNVNAAGQDSVNAPTPSWASRRAGTGGGIGGFADLSGANGEQRPNSIPAQAVAEESLPSNVAPPKSLVEVLDRSVSPSQLKLEVAPISQAHTEKQFPIRKDVDLAQRAEAASIMPMKSIPPAAAWEDPNSPLESKSSAPVVAATPPDEDQQAFQHWTDQRPSKEWWGKKFLPPTSEPSAPAAAPTMVAPSEAAPAAAPAVSGVVPDHITKGIDFMLENIEGSEKTNEPKGGVSQYGIGVGNSNGMKAETLEAARAAFNEKYLNTPELKKLMSSATTAQEAAAIAQLTIHSPSWAAQFAKTYKPDSVTSLMDAVLNFQAKKSEGWSGKNKDIISSRQGKIRKYKTG